MATVNDASGNSPANGSDPALDAHDFAIVPSDTAYLPSPVNVIYVGGTGDITAKNKLGVSIVFKAVPVGTQLEVGEIVRVMSTGTTATLMIGRVSKGRR